MKTNAPLRTKEIKIASYDPDKINDNARPPKMEKMVLILAVVLGSKVNQGTFYFIYKFNTRGSGNLWSKLLTRSKKCSPGGGNVKRFDCFSEEHSYIEY